MEYIRKKWGKPTMEKRLENLKKLFGDEVDKEIAWAKATANSELDALYLAYYNLKDRHCKIKREIFGKPKSVKYDHKFKNYGKTYDGYYSNWFTSVEWNANDYDFLWDVTNN